MVYNKEIYKRYYEKNKNKLREKKLKDYYNKKKDNPKYKEHKKGYDKKYYELNKEKMIKRVKEWRLKNPEKVKEQRKRYNKEKAKLRRIKYENTEKGKLTIYKNVVIRRDREFKNDVKLSNNQIKKLYSLYENKCLKCGSKENLTIEHIYPLSKGFGLLYNGFNMAILCKSCNSKKGIKNPSVFYTPEELNKIEEIKTKWLKINK